MLVAIDELDKAWKKILYSKGSYKCVTKQMKKILLIVEDEKSILKIMNDEFTKDNFEVITVQNGAEGLQAALQSHPDLIVLDITMPVMDGLSMLEKLRQDTWGSNVPVIILTNRDDSVNISAMMNNNVVRYLIKDESKLHDIAKEIREMLPIIERTYPKDKQ
jgi:two-component system cell cycle response regulator